MPTEKNPNSLRWLDTSTPSKWENFKQNARDAVAKVLVPTAMLTWLSSSPSSAMASVTWSTASDLVTICTATPWDDAPAHRTALLTPGSIEYSPVEIRDLLSEEILPIISQHSFGDRYKRIEHLRIAENTRISDMMHKYGAWDYSPEQYQALMSRINIGMTRETPKRYDNYEVIWWESIITPTYHGGVGRDILNTVNKYVNYKITSANERRSESIKNLSENDPNSINIFWNSNYEKIQKKKFIRDKLKDVKDPCRLKNFVIFASWSNIDDIDNNWIIENKIYNDEYDADENWMYSLASGANSDKNTDPHNHIMVTIGSNKYGDVVNVNENRQWSKFPVWFHDKVLFAGRAFPYKDQDSGNVDSEYWNYTTSFPNYLNVAMTALNAQNFADIDDVDELLEMMRSTAGTDYIRYDLNGDWDTNDTVSIAQNDGSYLHQPETVPLQLISPGEVFRTYGMAINETGWKRPSIQLPTSIAPWETLPISKWWYELPIFQIPGAEVNIDGEWIPFSNQYTDLIKTKNPAHLERRINGDLLSQMWYKPWDIIQWSVQAVDDTWWWLKDISKSFTITMTDGADSIHTPTANNTSSTLWWYSISGQKLSKRPTKPWVYIHNGKKVVIK